LRVVEEVASEKVQAREEEEVELVAELVL